MLLPVSANARKALSAPKVIKRFLARSRSVRAAGPHVTIIFIILETRSLMIFTQHRKALFMLVSFLHPGGNSFAK